MDLVSRLKFFMGQKKIASTQLADISGIPRPTVSQILNGRNKKISDELIGKLHSAFPDLSIMWLMFGEGDMETKSNIEFSEHQITQNPVGENNKFAGNQDNDFDDDLFFPVSENLSENFENVSSTNDCADYGHTEAMRSENQQDSSDNDTSVDNPAVDNSDSLVDKITSANSRVDKKIMNIVVLYDDGTFETFKSA